MDASNLKETLKAIDEVIAENKLKFERGKKLERLKTNPDFIDVIMNGYIESNAKELFEILTDPTGASPYSPEAIQMKLASISDFKGYIGTEEFKGTVTIDAEQALAKIAKEEEYRKEVTAEFANDEG